MRLLERLSQERLASYFLALWGVTFILNGIYSFYFDLSNPTLDSISTSIRYADNALAIIMGVVLILLSEKIRHQKK
jgi:hypothetical protein